MEYNMLSEIKGLQQELKKERAQKQKQQQKNELRGRQRNMEFLRITEENDRAIAVQAAQQKFKGYPIDYGSTSEHRQAEAVKMKRHVAARAKREQEVPRCFTRELPEQMAGAALEQEAGESSSLVMSTTSLAAGPRPKPDRGQPSRWAFHRKAMQDILVRIPGALQKRGKNLPGIVIITGPGSMCLFS